MQSPETLWKLALLKQSDLIREAIQKERIELARLNPARPQPLLWQRLATGLGDQMIAAGNWLKSHSAFKPVDVAVAPECGA